MSVVSTLFIWVDGPVTGRRLLDFRFSIFDFRGLALIGFRYSVLVLCKTALSLLVRDGAVGFFLGNVKWKVISAKCKMKSVGKYSSFTYYPSPEAKYKWWWKDLTWRLLSFFACVAIVSVTG